MMSKILCGIGIPVVIWFLSFSAFAEKSPNIAKKTGIELKKNSSKKAEDKHLHLNYEYGVGLTPMGAEKAGNKEGTIPPWTGGIKTPPPNYKKGMRHPDPFPEDTILFSIDSTNLEKYQTKLTPGQIALLKTYPTFKMNIYPTQRSASFPQHIYEATIVNEKSARLIKDGNIVDGASIGIPFPVPENGQEAIWNHLLRYRGEAVSLINVQIPVTAGGAYTPMKSEEEWYIPYSAGDTHKESNNKIFYILHIAKVPPSLAGTIYLIHEPIDFLAEKRSSWIYSPGQRRVNRVPGYEYDLFPDEVEGLRCIDMYDMYNGAIDRYDWELKGKKEIYVPYNAYKLHSGELKCKDVLRKNHINTEYARYELHRVWVVDATLKKGMHHVYPRRTFYLDEDSWQILLIDYYDADGNIWRLSEGHAINYYEVPTLWTTLQIHHDIKSGRYYVNGFDNEDRGYDFSIKRTAKDYAPSKLRKMGKR